MWEKWENIQHVAHGGVIITQYWDHSLSMKRINFIPIQALIDT